MMEHHDFSFLKGELREEMDVMGKLFGRFEVKCGVRD